MQKSDVTLKDVAQAVGKSVATVSKALRGHDDIAPETRQTIKQTARQMGYSPNITAQRLQKQRTDAIGLILPVLSARQADPFYVELLSGVADEVAVHRFDLLVSTRSPGDEEATAYRRLVNERRVDGVIVAQPRQNDWRIDFLTTQELPFVVVGDCHTLAEFPGVCINTAAALKQAVGHLVEQGRTRLTLIPPPPDLLFAEACIAGFQAALVEHPAVIGTIAPAVLELSQKEGYRAGQMLLDTPDSADAIIACHDLVAMGAMSAAQDQGFEIGSDLAVVGIGDILLAEYAQPPLTTVHQPAYSIGQRACQTLMSLIAGQQPSPPQVIVEPWLVVRPSSGLDFWL